MKNNYIIEILIISLVLSSFAIADEIQFFNDLKKTFKENIPHINFFQEGEHYCDSEFIRCNDEKKITTIEITNIRNKDKRLPYSPTNINNDITLPSSISTLTHLTELNISIAVVRINWDNIVNLRSLRTIKIISNNIYEFLRLDGLSLTHLHLSYNNIEQDLQSISFSKTLKYINLSNNNFCGDIKIFNNIPDLEKLDLSYNPLLYVNTSQLHLSFKLSVLSLVGNKLIGNIPNFRNNGELTLLDLSYNDISGSIPSFNKNPKLKMLNLKNNKLTGSMPSFNNNNELWFLDFSDNYLSDTIPDFSKNPKLKMLYLGSNKLVGKIPSFSNNAELKLLNVSKNNLSGNVPDFSKNSNLTTLDISYNNLSGVLPSFADNENLHLIYLHNNTGFIYDCSNNKYLIDPAKSEDLYFCELGELALHKKCGFSVSPGRCKITVRTVITPDKSNTKSIYHYYINVFQASILLVLLFFT